MTSMSNENCYSILKGVCVYWKILGLCPLFLVEATIGRPSYCDIFYTTFITLAYIILYYRAVVNRMNYIMTQETPLIVIADFLALSIECFMIIATWLIVTLHHNRLKKILEMFKKIQKTSEMFDIGQDFRKIFKTIKFHTIILNITWFILYLMDHVFLYEKSSFKLDIWLPFNLPRIISHNVVLMFVDVLWILKKFFYSLNKKIQNLSRKPFVNRVIIAKEKKRSLHDRSIQFFDTQSQLTSYGQLHSDLITLTKMIVELFSLSIILVLLVDLILLASDFYILCLLPKEAEFMTVKKMGTFVGICLWWCLHLAETTTMIAMSDSTTSEANRTGIVLHTMLIMDYMDKYIDSAHILSYRLLQSYFNINFYGMFQMRLSLVHKVIGMVVTYLTIMVQLDIQDRQQQQTEKAMLLSNRTHTY